MAKASDNLYPSILVVEGAAPATPSAGNQRLFIDTADHKLKRVNSSAAVTTIEGSGGSSTLAGDSDVTITSAADGDLLRYNSGDAAWENYAEAQCIVRNSTGQSVSSGTETALTWDTEDLDTDTIHSTSVNTSRLTATHAGRYLFTASVNFAANVTGVRQLYLYKNGSGSAVRLALVAVPAATTGLTGLSTQRVLDLAASDYVEAYAFQTSGSPLSTIGDGSGATYASMVRIA